MRNFLVAGDMLIETIVKVDHIPIEYKPITVVPDTIFTSAGGDSYNEALALKFLGNNVDYLTIMGKDDDPAVLNPSGSDVTLNTDYVLPLLERTPRAVILYDKERRQQFFQDMEEVEDTSLFERTFQDRVRMADMVVLSNMNYCRPLIKIAKDAGIKIAVNCKYYCDQTMKFNEEFMAGADIIYIGDDNIVDSSYDFVKSLADEYDPEIIIMGQGRKGLIIYSKPENIIAHYNTVKTHDVVNTVGAGNALFSCFLHFYANNADSIHAIKNALLFASYKIGFIGSSNGFMTEEQLEQWHSLIWRDEKPVC